MTTLLKKWKLARMERHLQYLNQISEYYHNEQRRLALEAYEIPDMMVEPLRWGRLQNAANWAGYHSRKHREEADRLSDEIDSFRKYAHLLNS